MSNRWQWTEITPYESLPKSDRIVGAADALSFLDSYQHPLHGWKTHSDRDESRKATRKRGTKMSRYGSPKKKSSRKPRKAARKSPKRVSNARKLVKYNRLVAEGVSASEAHAEVYGGVRRVGKKRKAKSKVAAPKRARRKRSSRFGGTVEKRLSPESRKVLYDAALKTVLKLNHGTVDAIPTPDDLFAAEKLVDDNMKQRVSRESAATARIRAASQRVERETRKYVADVIRARKEAEKLAKEEREQKQLADQVERLAQKQLAALSSI